MASSKAVPFTAVAFEDEFWAPRQAAVRTATIPFLYGQYEKAGIFAALDVHAPVDALPIPHEVTPIGTKPATPVMYAPLSLILKHGAASGAHAVS